jgi:putative peptidoglycan lipid II flippase
MDDPSARRQAAAGSGEGPPPRPAAPDPPPRRCRSGAASVGAGILASRIFGLVREQVVAFYFGVGAHADALTAALRVPNALQNLLGEGALSASFIPIYSRMLGEGRREEAGRFAGAIFGLLLAAAGGLALAGVALARALVAVIAPGFLRDAAAVAAGQLPVDRFELTVHAVRILFPMTGCLVLSVWALAILNSHRRFFLPYFAPVLWNSAMIAALLLVGGRHPQPSLALATRLLYAFCWGALVGGLLQFLVQLPAVVPLLVGFRFSLSRDVPGVRQALAAWGPVVAGRGVVQLAGYLDLFLATWLAAGATSANRFAQMLYMLPISLFGMSVAASELPELSRLGGGAEGGEGGEALLARVRRALGAVAFLNVPTVVGYAAFGFLIAGALYHHGRFDLAATWLVYLTLCGYSTGILATTSSRLLQNTFYALGDTRTPARIAVERVVTSAVVAIPFMLWLDRFPLAALVGSAGGLAPAAPALGWPAGAGGAGGAGGSGAATPLYLGVLGLSFASGAGAWLELMRLRAALRRRLPSFDLPWRTDGGLALLAAAAALAGGIAWWFARSWPVVPRAVLVLAVYGGGYLLAAQLAGVEELAAFSGRLGPLGRWLRRR